MKSTSGHCEEHFVARGYTVCVGRQEGVSTGQDHTALGGYLVVHGLWREGAGGGRGPYAVRTPSVRRPVSLLAVEGEPPRRPRRGPIADVPERVRD